MEQKNTNMEPKRDENGKWLPGKSANEATQFKPGHSVRRYQSTELMESAINGYFEKIEKDKKMPTVTGLALFLGFTSRTSFLNYRREPGYEQFHEIMEKARTRIEAVLEESLISGKGSTIGLIFSLKNNYSWNDKQEITHSLPEKKIEGFNYLPPSE